jgi:molybdopterin-guanine dinucleotide biosynthesis protein A
MKISLILLAAGKGIRLGRDKGLLRVGDETLVERHLRQASLAGIQNKIVVANITNETTLCKLVHGYQPRPRVVLQEIETAEGAIRAGLRDIPDSSQTVIISCVNDVVPDDCYSRLMEALKTTDASLVVTTKELEWPFIGGRLRINGNQLKFIDERPPGGCVPGDQVNILIHALIGLPIRTAILTALKDGQPYETILNSLLAEGMLGTFVKTEIWVGVKIAPDLHRVEELFHKRCW